MAGNDYTIDYSDQTLPGKSSFTIDAGSLNQTTSLNLVGWGYVRYGEHVAENFVKLLENFASRNPPSHPTMGQLWYDGNTNTLKVYNNASTWASLGLANLYLPLTGGTMLGTLTLNGAPTSTLHAATKGYVDSVALTQSAADTRYVNTSGDTMLGTLTLNGAPTLDLHAATKVYVDSRSVPTTVGGTTGQVLTLNSLLVPTWMTPGITQIDGDNRYVKLSGSTMTGSLILSASPTTTSPNMQAATKQYVDTKPLPIATSTVLGGIKTGTNLTAASDGTLNVTPITRLIRMDHRKSWLYKTDGLAVNVKSWDRASTSSLVRATPANYNISFINITLTTSKNHPMYTSNTLGHYNTLKWASSLCTEQVFEYLEPQPFRLAWHTGSNAKAGISGVSYNVSYYFVIEKYNGSTWTPVQFDSEWVFTTAKDSSNAFIGYTAVPAKYSTSPAEYEFAFDAKSPADVVEVGYGLSGSIINPPIQAITPPLLANTQYRFIVMQYALSSSSSTSSVAYFGANTEVIVEGE